MTDKVSPEECRLYYETTERVIDRRVALNNWNYGVCVAILVGIGLAANWTITNSRLQLPALGWIVLISVLGMLICSFWVSRLEDLKALNDAKFAILNEMATRVRFEGDVLSAEPFRREWEQLAALGATRTINKGQLTVLKASGSELLMPRAFMLVFAAAGLAAVTVAVVNWTTLARAPLELENSNEDASRTSVLVGPGGVWKTSEMPDARQK